MLQTEISYHEGLRSLEGLYADLNYWSESCADKDAATTVAPGRCIKKPPFPLWHTVSTTTHPACNALLYSVSKSTRKRARRLCKVVEPGQLEAMFAPVQLKRLIEASQRLMELLFAVVGPGGCRWALGSSASGRRWVATVGKDSHESSVTTRHATRHAAASHAMTRACDMSTGIYFSSASSYCLSHFRMSS